MIVYRVQRFVSAWQEGDGRMRAFLLWNASNTVAAFALAAGAVGLLVVTSLPGFQRGVLVGYVAAAVVWTLSVFLIGPVYEHLGPPSESASE